MDSKSKRKKPVKRPVVWPEPPQPGDSPLKAHFRASGTLFEITPYAVFQRLKKVMGSKRYNHWQAVCSEEIGPEPVNVYELFVTAEEINTLFSAQRAESLSIAEWITSAMTPGVTAGSRVIDLGCGSGILTGWLAKQLPGCDVVGVDEVENMIRAAQQLHAAPRLSFHRWNFCEQPPAEIGLFDRLCTCLGLDFPCLVPQNWDLSLTTLREGSVYNGVRQWSTPAFEGWRQIAMEGAELYAVLRIPTVLQLLAVVDAAAESGWQIDLERSCKLQSPDGQRFPALMFRAASGAQPRSDESDLLWLFLGQDLRNPNRLPDLVCGRSAERPGMGFYVDPEASWLWRALTDKTIRVDQTQTLDGGVVMRSVTGTSTHWAFQYSRATTGFSGLALHSLDKADTLKPRFDWRPFGSGH